MLDGKPLSLTYAELSPNRHVSLAYSFKYFQDYDETVQLPQGFEPTRVGVEIHSGRDMPPQLSAGVRVEGAGYVGRNRGDGGNTAQGDADVQTETE